ncbi:MAG: hypothetical protein WD530_06770 [Vicingaceae bacterium]
MNRKLKRVLFGIVALTFIYSCTDDYFEFDKIKTNEWKPALALPVVNSSLTLEELLIKEDEDGVINEDPQTGILEIVYDGKVFSPIGEAKVPLPNQNFSRSIQSPTPLPSDGSQTPPITYNDEITFNSQVEIDTLVLKNGHLALTLENTFEHNLNVTVELPSFTDANNQALTLNYSIPASNGISPTVRSKNVDLAKYTIDMKHGVQNHSTFPVEVTIDFDLIAGNSSTPADELSVNAQVNQLAFKNFVGYLGQSNLMDLELDTIDINLFKNFISGNFFLSNPFLDIDIYNSYGIPTELEFELLKSRNPDKTPAEIDVQLPNNPIVLNSTPSFKTDSTNIQLTNSNSNIDDVVSSLLKHIIYDAKAEFNPNGPSTRNYLTDTSRIGLEVYFRLPFEGYANDFFLIDTIGFNFEGVDELESGLIKLYTENTFPIDVEMQVYFMDSSYQVIDSLFDATIDKEVIKAAPVNSGGRSIGITTHSTEVEVDRSRLKELVNGRYAIIHAELNTLNYQDSTIVAIYDDYHLNVNLGVKATIKID